MCVCACVAVGGGCRGISASQLFPRHGKERGRHRPPDPSTERAGPGGGRAELQPRPASWEQSLPWGQNGQGASSLLLQAGGEHEPQSVGP